MERITESTNFVRIDKATSGEYVISFTITQSNGHITDINVIGTKNEGYSFGINHNPQTLSTGINFAQSFDFVIAQQVMDEIEVIKTELITEN